MISSVLVLALLASAGEAESMNPVEEAKKYFEAGRQAYEAGDYPAAAAAFDEANRLSPRPAIVFSMAQALRQQYFLDHDSGKLRRAIELYTSYLAETPKGGRRNDAVQHLEDLKQQLAIVGAAGAAGDRPVAAEVKTQLMISSRTPGATASIDGSDPQEVPLIAEVEPGKHAIQVEAEGYFPAELSGTAVEGRLVVAEVNLTELPAVIRVTAPEGADVMIDGRPLGQAPLLLPVEVPAGDHFVAVTARGSHPFVRTMKIARGEEVTVVATLESTAQRDISYYFLGAGAALFAATAVTVVGALASEGQARLIQRKLDVQMVNLTIAERDEFNDLRNQRADLITASSLLLAGSVVLGVTGGLLFFVDAPSVQSRGAIPLTVEGPASGAIVPFLTPHGAGATFSASF